MTDNKRRNRLADLDATAPQVDGFSWSETQTGLSLSQQDEPRDLDGSGGGEGAVTMLDYEGTPVVTATETPDSQTSSTRPRSSHP